LFDHPQERLHASAHARSSLSAGIRVAHLWRPRARPPSRRRSASDYDRTRERAVLTSSTRERLHAGATSLIVRSPPFPTFPPASSPADTCAVSVFHIHDSDLEVECLGGSSLHARLTASVSSGTRAPACASHPRSRTAAPPGCSARAGVRNRVAE
jgi:hypothetical protein